MKRKQIVEFKMITGIGEIYRNRSSLYAITADIRQIVNYYS